MLRDRQVITVMMELQARRDLQELTVQMEQPGLPVRKDQQVQAVEQQGQPVHRVLTV